MADRNIPAMNLAESRYRLQVIRPKKGKGSYSRKNSNDE